MNSEGISKMPEHMMRNDIKKEFTMFIQDFQDERGEYKYRLAAKDALNNIKHHIVFSFRDLMHYNSELSAIIFNEYYRFEPIINEALTTYMVELDKN